VNITIMGAGSLGCLLGGYLAHADHEVSMVDVVPERVAAIQAHGIVVEGVRGDFEARARAAEAPDGPPADLVIVCVKAQDTDRAAATLAEHLGDRTLVLTLQNGLGNLEKLTHQVPRERILAGVTSLGATLLAPGRVLHAGDGETVVGSPAGGATPAAQTVARLLSDARIETRAVDDVQSHIWSKLCVNAGINALTALVRVRNGRLLEGSAERVLELAVRECAAVATSSGIALDPDAMLHRVREVARLTASNRSSMLADVLAGRRTEVDAINGAVVHRGAEVGVPTPVNETLTHLIHALEETADLQEH